jgi:putative tryptophan/tyrosine transport system substrate-binding protein
MRKFIVGIHFLFSSIIFILVLTGCNPNNAAETQQIRIGVLSGSPIFDTAIDGFKAGLAENGFIEGENVSYEILSADGNADLMRTYSEQFVADGVDLIFTTTNGAALAARDATAGTQIPVVFTFVIAPVEAGIVDNLRAPSGNLTGVRNPLDDFVGRRIELLLQIDPDATRIWTPYDAQYSTVNVVLGRLHEFAAILNIEVVETMISSPDDVVTSLAQFEEAGDPPFDAILIFPDLTVQQAVSWTAIRDYANTNRLPILANTPAQVQEGALFSYLIDNVASGQQAARLAAQILEGISPENLPVETAELSLMLNLVSADNLGLEVPTEIIASAQTVIREEQE